MSVCVIFDATMPCDHLANCLSTFHRNHYADGLKIEFIQKKYFYLLMLSNVTYVLNLYVYMENIF